MQTAVDVLLNGASPARWTRKLPGPKGRSAEGRYRGRTRLLERLSWTLCEAWQIERCELTFAEFKNTDQLGLTTWEKPASVSLSFRLLRDDSPTRALATLVHEHRHLVQLEVINENAGSSIDYLPDQLRRWRFGWTVYEADRAAGGSDYYLNSLEVDARDTQWRVLAAYWEQAR